MTEQDLVEWAEMLRHGPVGPLSSVLFGAEGKCWRVDASGELTEVLDADEGHKDHDHPWGEKNCPTCWAVKLNRERV